MNGRCLIRVLGSLAYLSCSGCSDSEEAQQILVRSSATATPYKLALADGSVYFSSIDAEVVMKVPTSGGAVVDLNPSPGPGRGECIVVDQDNVYLAVGNGSGLGEVIKVAKSGGSVVLAPAQGDPKSVVVDASNVYWVNGYNPGAAGNGTVMTVPIAGGTPQQLSTGNLGAAALAINAGRLYFGSNGALVSMPVSGGTPDVLVQQSGPVEQISLRDGTIYWAASGGIRSAPLAGGEATLVSEWISAGGPSGLAVDDAFVYWPAWLNGSVFRAPRTGGAPIEIASGDITPEGIAVDETSVYYSDFVARTLVKLRKDRL